MRQALEELQAAFKEYLLTGAYEAQLAAQVQSTGGIPVETRLDVYRHAYHVRLQEALVHDFPALLAVVGEQAFGPLAAAYLNNHPSARPSLRWLGYKLPQWLHQVRREPALAELATLEWAVLHAFDAPDAPCLTLEDLAAVPVEKWPDLYLTLHPAITLLQVHANVREVWLAVRRGDPVPAFQLTAEYLVVWRFRTEPVVEAVSSACFTLLDAWTRGERFGMACEALVQSLAPADVPIVAARCLHDALARGWVC